MRGRLRVRACVQVYFAREGDTVNSCTRVSAERRSYQRKGRRETWQELRKRKSWHGSRPGSRGSAKTEAIKVKNLIPVQGGPHRKPPARGDEGAGAQGWTCPWGWRLPGREPRGLGVGLRSDPCNCGEATTSLKQQGDAIKVKDHSDPGGEALGAGRHGLEEDSLGWVRGSQ